MTPFAMLSLAVPLGLAALPPFARLTSAGLPGLAFMSAWAVIVLFLFAAGVLGAPLSVASWILCAAAGGGAVFAVLFRRPPLFAILHPLTILPIAIVGLIIIAGPVVYQIYAWDSWTNWAGWSRQMVAADAVYSPEMWIATRGDMPGWPLAMALPGLASGTFVEADAWSVAISLHVGLLALMFDLFRSLLRNRALVDGASARLAAWAILLAGLAIELSWTLLPKLLLIEEPQYYLLAGGFFAIGAGIVTGQRMAALVSATLLMAAAYSFKTSFVIYAPAFLMSAAFLVFGDADRWRLGGRGVLALSGCIVALAVVSLAWSAVAPPGRCQADTAGMLARLVSDAPVQGVPFGRFAGDVLRRMVDFALGWKLPLSLAALLGVVLFARSRIGIVVAATGVVLWTAFYVGLVSGMAACFSPDEIENLASVQRYTRVPLRLSQTIGIVLLVAAAAHFLGKAPARMFTRSAITIGLGLAVLLLAGYQVYVGQKIIRHVAVRENIDADFRNRAQAAKRDVGRLDAARPAPDGQGPLRLLYFSVPPWVEWVAANYHGLGSRRGDPVRRIAAEANVLDPAADTMAALQQRVSVVDALVLTEPPSPAVVDGIPEIAVAIAACRAGDAGRLLLRPAQGAPFVCRPRSSR